LERKVNFYRNLFDRHTSKDDSARYPRYTPRKRATAWRRAATYGRALNISRAKRRGGEKGRAKKLLNKSFKAVYSIVHGEFKRRPVRDEGYKPNFAGYKSDEAYFNFKT
jgi:hypothetical protein